MNLSEQSNNEITLYWISSERNPQLREELRAEIRRRIPSNKGVSKELLFTICRTNQRSVNVFFLPTTLSYDSLGQFITVVDLELERSQFEELLLNTVNKIATNGIVKCKKLNNTSATEMTSIVQFNTNEISHIE